MKTRPITDLFDARTVTVDPHETLRDYHYRRIDRLNDGEFPIQEENNGILLVHVASVNSLGPYLNDRIEVPTLLDEVEKIPVLKRSRYSDYGERFNFCSRGVEGSKSSGDSIVASTWLDRTGILESISSDLVYEKDNGLALTTETLEKSLTQMVDWYLERISELDDDPVFVTMSYLNMSGIYTPRIGGGFARPREVETSFIETPIVTISEDNGNVRDQLTPLLRPFWQEVQYRESPYMKEDGWQFSENND